MNLKTTIELHAGGPGSGRRPEGGTNKPDLEKIFPKSLADLNNHLKQNGMNEGHQLVRGSGYYYFITKNKGEAPSNGIYVNNAKSLSVGRWVREYGDAKESMGVK